ncbi:hypothetical protein AC579_8339 [Pseudocercospora musae]|uniref:Uncharacterized protein n=1 Tax=Pseudocercospora musae TaxID=113226 RepID=A0A139I741_9PEZI|nr:hypothetical protein AC579_8339 [Pseudocercospora musae]
MTMFPHALRGSTARGSTMSVSRAASLTTKPPRPKKIIDETTMGGAQHKVSLSGPSLGHLISELSATRPGMEAIRNGRTMSEENRTQARTVVKYIVGIPVVIGTGIVGYNFALKREEK